MCVVVRKQIYITGQVSQSFLWRIRYSRGKKKTDVYSQGRRTSIHPTPTRLVPVLAIDAHRLEKGHRSVGEHQNRGTKEFQPLQPVSLLHQGPT